jgi:hypothetical protein
MFRNAENHGLQKNCGYGWRIWQMAQIRAAFSEIRLPHYHFALTVVFIPQQKNYGEQQVRHHQQIQDAFVQS